MFCAAQDPLPGTNPTALMEPAQKYIYNTNAVHFPFAKLFNPIFKLNIMI